MAQMQQSMRHIQQDEYEHILVLIVLFDNIYILYITKYITIYILFYT